VPVRPCSDRKRTKETLGWTSQAWKSSWHKGGIIENEGQNNGGVPHRGQSNTFSFSDRLPPEKTITGLLLVRTGSLWAKREIQPAHGEGEGGGRHGLGARKRGEESREAEKFLKNLSRKSRGTSPRGGKKMRTAGTRGRPTRKASTGSILLVSLTSFLSKGE